MASVAFYRPVHIAHVAELSIPRRADPQAIATVLAALARIRRVVIQTALPAGTMGSRLGNALMTAGCQLVAEGANPYGVDDAALALGFATGPFLMMDRIELDRVQARLDHYAAQKALAPVGIAFLSALIDQGRTGKSAGRGVYGYSSDVSARDTEVRDLAADMAVNQRAAGLDGPDLELALLGAVVNEAVALIAEGAVRRASDLDLLMVRGFGFDAARGGPLLWADLTGLFALYQKMQALQPLSDLWRPHEKLGDMIRNGQGFFGRSAG